MLRYYLLFFRLRHCQDEAGFLLFTFLSVSVTLYI